MPKVTFQEERCKGCELCTSVCPRKIVVMSNRINKQGFHVATVTDQEKCIACAFCARICPDAVIQVEK